ncbi:hypothetical protein Tcan_06518 [Toxocara canis]|uniref:Uncharacterized protein n=1 Tax=Toxocara canis TaxID=6265 RepID=A0A0B2VFJ4_TOXCA|nr:hypothetical protein Tcan_06518 [Toxocara canis]
MEENVFDGIDNVEQSFGPMSNAEVFSAKPFLEVTPGVTEILMFSVDLSKTPARYDCRNTMALKMDDGQTRINLIFKKDTVYASVEDGDISVPIFRMALIILLPIAIVATVPTAALMWLEAIEKRRYQLAKDKPIKLKLTREYLAKVRPPKKRQVTKPQADAQEHK